MKDRYFIVLNCRIRGNVFVFLMKGERDRTDFPEAVKHIAGK